MPLDLRTPVVILALLAMACHGTVTAPNDGGNGGDSAAFQSPCGFSVSRTDATLAVDSSGGSLKIAVPASTGCAWAVSTNAAFLSIADQGSGNGPSTVVIAVAPNTGGDRSGTLTIAGVTYTVSQKAAPCIFSLTGDTNRTFGAGGGSGVVTVNVTQGGSCSWSATSDASFVSITSGATGSGNGSVTYVVAPNPGASRRATLTIGGQSVAVNQDVAAPTCVFALSATSDQVPAAFGTYSVTVTRTGGDASCSFTASTTTPWISLTGVRLGTSSPTDVPFSVATNTSTGSRIGAITISWTGGSQDLIVTQDGAATPPPCDYALSATSDNLPANAGSYSVTVTRTSGNSNCSFTASTNAAFITLSGVTSSTASRVDVPFAVPANGGAASRTGNITITWSGGGQQLVVTQAGQ